LAQPTVPAIQLVCHFDGHFDLFGHGLRLRRQYRCFEQHYSAIKLNPMNDTCKKTKPLVILSVLFFVALTSAFAGWTVARGKGAGQSRQNGLLSPINNFVDKNDLIINIQPLRDRMQEIGKDPNVSIYFEFLNTGANIAVNKDTEFWPASLMKIPIAMAVMKKIERGDWKLSNELMLLEQDKDSNFGELYKAPANTRITIQRLLDEMLINSDNTARTIFMRNLDKKDIEEVLAHLGIEDIFNTEQQVSTKKYSIFWRSLYTSSYLSPEHSGQLIEIMAKSASHEYLASGLPAETMFSHKIGVLYDRSIYADSGIVYAVKRPYILTVMINGKDKKTAETMMSDISRSVYDYISRY
jgi:beta-lactamase class A